MCFSMFFYYGFFIVIWRRTANIGLLFLWILFLWRLGGSGGNNCLFLFLWRLGGNYFLLLFLWRLGNHWLGGNYCLLLFLWRLRNYCGCALLRRCVFTCLIWFRLLNYLYWLCFCWILYTLYRLLLNWLCATFFYGFLLNWLCATFFYGFLLNLLSWLCYHLFNLWLWRWDTLNFSTLNWLR